MEKKSFNLFYFVILISGVLYTNVCFSQNTPTTWQDRLEALKNSFNEENRGDVLVFKVGGKMFCFAPMDEGELKMNLKCDPEEAIELRERFPAVLPGYHMNKRYWNTVLIDGSVSDNMLRIWIGNSYRLVLSKLSKSDRKLLEV